MSLSYDIALRCVGAGSVTCGLVGVGHGVEPVKPSNYSTTAATAYSASVAVVARVLQSSNGLVERQIVRVECSWC